MYYIVDVSIIDTSNNCPQSKIWKWQ